MKSEVLILDLKAYIMFYVRSDTGKGYLGAHTLPTKPYLLFVLLITHFSSHMTEQGEPVIGNWLIWHEKLESGDSEIVTGAIVY